MVRDFCRGVEKAGVREGKSGPRSRFFDFRGLMIQLSCTDVQLARTTFTKTWENHC